MGVADAEVVHASGSAEAHLAEFVEAVVAESVVAGRFGSGGFGFREGAVGLSWCGPVAGSVGALFVVEVAELVELTLERGESCGGWLLVQPGLQGLVEPFDLPLGLGVAGVAVLLGDPEDREEVLEGVLSAAEAGRCRRGRCRSEC